MRVRNSMVRENASVPLYMIPGSLSDVCGFHGWSGMLITDLCRLLGKPKPLARKSSDVSSGHAGNARELRNKVNLTELSLLRTM